VILENLANVNLENDLKIVADHGRIGVNIAYLLYMWKLTDTVDRIKCKKMHCTFL
jgi:hypothetical protein